MAIYQRMSMVSAAQFDVKLFTENELNYPDVFDKAMFAAAWHNKTALDGRYYIVNQPNTMIGVNECQTINDGDYILREEGFSYVISKEVFERNYEKLCD